jgi:UDP-N-acetylmuramate dehydrogenase
VRMNARCYGGEISNFVTSVTVVTKEGSIKTYSDLSSVFRGYKDTLFMDNGDLVCEVEITLEEVGDEKLKVIKEKMDFCEKDRTAKGQFLYPTCGCVFKNNYDPKVSVSSGMLLEKSGLKNLEFGGAQVSDGHANFVYNKSATSSDILNLSFKMRERVYEMFGVWLDYEMEILGSLSNDQKEEISKNLSLSKDKDLREKLSKVREEFNKNLSK